MRILDYACDLAMESAEELCTLHRLVIHTQTVWT